ncbi:phospholipase B1, membrane-associated isoform X2 [Esox lucius]|uniref:phospholipase B1, membrane-associated isoform X2 n=1 Tax=Esox lucius TaxID=8010 RepID=UPI00147747E5|nr:phospholipase B1, membrane-associated isoform X2 [Esox lucius]
MIATILFSACILSYCCHHGYAWGQEADQIPNDVKILNQIFPDTAMHPAFRCPDMSPSPTIPTSVEFVKAADIKVIAALGDSLTTAIAANGSTILSLPVEYRHVSWSIGGYGTYEDVITLANILKLFNPTLLGPAPTWTVKGQPTSINETGFNFAVTGHNSLNISEQTRHMINTFKSYPGMNFKEDWKLVTVLIGMNDICDYCKNKTLFSADNYIYHITEMLDTMMNEVPRMIVNIVQILPMESLREVQRPTVGCLFQKKFCSCLVLPEDNSSELEEVRQINIEFQRRLEELLHSDRFFKQDFAVILQPYLQRAQPPRLPTGEIDLSYFSADCFHFRVKGHEELAKGLWNNMFQPEGEKELIDTFSDPVRLICPPKEHPYIYTRPRALSSGPPPTYLTMPALILLILTMSAAN